jgi:NADH-quinone oxidoreductase subunit A
MLRGYGGVLFYFVLTVGFAVVIIVLSHFIGKRTVSREKLMPYECGVDPIGNARIRFSVKFYLIAMLFIVFDLESVFLYAFAVVFKELRLLGLIEIAIFIVVLVVGLVYAWGKGALEWE